MWKFLPLYRPTYIGRYMQSNKDNNTEVDNENYDMINEVKMMVLTQVMIW